MFPRILFTSVLAFWGLQGSAKPPNVRRIVTPFTPRIEDSAGYKSYQLPSQMKEYRRVSLEVGYGISPYTAKSSFGDRVLTVRNGLSVNYDSEVQKDLGSIHIGFGYDATPWLEIGFMFIYSNSEGFVPGLAADLKDSWYTFMPDVRVNWMRSAKLTLYSRVAFGLTLGNREAKTISYSGGAFAWQLSPVGIEYSPSVCGIFVEGGYGFLGYITAGIRFRFGKSKSHVPVQNDAESLWKLR